MTVLAGRLERDIVLRSLIDHSVPGVERVNAERGTVSRLVATASGPRVLTVLVRDDGVELADDTDAATRAAVHAWFDLDADVTAIVAAFADDPLLGPLVAARPALRVIGHLDPFEIAAQTVLGQQVSLAACRTFTGRLAAAYGTPGPDGLIMFPTPATVASAAHDELRAVVGITNARARTVLALAGAFAEGLGHRKDRDPVRARADLLALPGIGPWTVDYLALRVLHDADAFPVGDLVLRRALGGVTPAEASARGEAWRPWRAYATMHLWTADADRRAKAGH